MSAPLTVAIAGASGYAGGEFLRLALQHPHLRVTQVSSERFAGMPAFAAHPNLRGATGLRFAPLAELEPADVLVSALPHGELGARGDELLGLATRVVDLAADFRLRDPAAYERHYGGPHPNPGLLGGFVNAIPELHRAELAGATRLAGAGCIATAVMLGLAPLVRAGLVARRDVIAEARVGSSAAGNRPGPGSHHAERSGAVRTYAPVRHRHEAEIEQELGPDVRVHLTATAVERVRGVHATQHVFVPAGTRERDLAAAFRTAWGGEPFVRLLGGVRGVQGAPDPRILSGSNWCDISWALDADSGRAVITSALDNLVKGTAGHALQALNIALGWPEDTGLGFTGLHP